MPVSPKGALMPLQIDPDRVLALDDVRLRKSCRITPRGAADAICREMVQKHGFRQTSGRRCRRFSGPGNAATDGDVPRLLDL